MLSAARVFGQKERAKSTNFPYAKVLLFPELPKLFAVFLLYYNNFPECLHIDILIVTCIILLGLSK